MGSLITAKFGDAPKRAISLMFYEHEYVMLTCPSADWKRVPVLELTRYLPRSVITKMVFNSTHTVTEDTYVGKTAGVAW